MAEDTKSKAIFVTGTDTGVGKTFLSALLVKLLNEAGVRTTYFKPVATGCESGNILPEDVAFVSEVAQVDLSDPIHCPVRYQKPLAPLAAARLEDRPVSLGLIVERFNTLAKSNEFVVVEGVGGLMVPLAPGYLVADLMQELGLPSVVVARPGLGTINHTLMTIQGLQKRGIPVLGFITSGHKQEGDEAAQTSPALIEEFSGTRFLGHVPLFEPGRISVEAFLEKKAPFLRRFVEEHISESSTSSIPNPA